MKAKELAKIFEEASGKLNEAKLPPFRDGWIYSDGKDEIVRMKSDAGKKQLKKIMKKFNNIK